MKNKKKKPKNVKDSKKPKSSNNNQELSLEQWAKLNQDYFGSNNFDWSDDKENEESWDFLDPDSGEDPEELDFDHER